jgi:beta-glucanase (GH16 family)
MTQNINRTFVLLSLVILVVSCEVTPEQTLPDRSYEMVWSDEFDADAGTSPDAAKWVYDLGTGQNGWGNNELQTYTDDAENISTDGEGNLKINAIRNGSSYTSARIKTEGLFTQKYGRIEARIKTPSGAGIWPAFWMLGSNIDEVSWPQCGEIDIMEQKGSQSSITYSSLHGPGYSGGNAATTPYGLQDGRFDSDFNIYAIEWGEDYVDFFVNDFLFKRLTPVDVSGEWVYNQPFFLILNVAVGGSFVGPPNENTPSPATMSIDYVRVYKEI